MKFNVFISLLAYKFACAFEYKFEAVAPNNLIKKPVFGPDKPVYIMNTIIQRQEKHLVLILRI